MIWVLILVTAIIAGWHVYEGRWDRHLFRDGCRNLSAKEARNWLRAHPETQVLDVRSKREFEAGALPNAVNISISAPTFENQLSALDQEKPVIIYCAGGFRSRKAAEKLKHKGFKHILHIHRGYLSWKPD